MQVWIICAVCRTAFRVKKKRVNTAKFCNLSCALKAGRTGKFTWEQAVQIRKQYETSPSPSNRLRTISMNELGELYSVNGQTIGRAIKWAGGKTKSRGEARRLHSSERFERIWRRYRLAEKNYWKLWELQNAKCFWCNRPLPRTADCVIDHRGRWVRGLCCPDNKCNMICGHLEKEWRIPASRIKDMFIGPKP